MNESPQPFIRPVILHAGRFGNKRNVSLHGHAGTELVLVTEGSCSIDTKGVRLDGERDTLFVLPANMPHSQINRSLTRTLYIVLKPDERLLDETPRTIDTKKDSERFIFRWMNDLTEMYCNIQSVPPGLMEGVAASLLFRIRQLEERTIDQKRLHPTLARALKFMNDSYAQPITVKEIADHAITSPSYLSMLFRNELGIAIMKYLQNVRMAFAKRLLLNKYLSVREIACQCGYEDPNYFTRLFFKINKTSPTRFRKTLG